MKSWYLLPAFVLGAFAGWLGRGPETASVTPSPVAAKPSMERPASLRAEKPPEPSSFPVNFSPRKRAQAFQGWIGGMNASNWQSYVDQAVSPEAMDRLFLHSPSPESLLFLRKLGEIAPREALKFMEERKLESCIAEVAEGWAQVAPAEAFQWHMTSNPYLEARASGRIAAALLAEDPAAVLGNPQFQIQDKVVQELPRQLGIQKVSELLESRWDAKPGDDERALNFRKHEFDQWSGVVVTSILRSHSDAQVKREAMIAWYESIASRPEINPKIRDLVNFQIRYQRSIQNHN